MWIRRSFGDDQLYTTIVQAYIDTLLKRGYNFECFVGMSILATTLEHNRYTFEIGFFSGKTDPYRGRPITYREALASQIRHSEVPPRQRHVWACE